MQSRRETKDIVVIIVSGGVVVIVWNSTLVKLLSFTDELDVFVFCPTIIT